MSDLVKYDNQMNTFGLRGLNVIEKNLFFGCISKVIGNGTELMQFSRHEIAEISGYDLRNNSSKQFKKDMENMAKKLLQLNVSWNDPETDDDTVIFSLFHYFRVNPNFVKIQISEHFESWFNNFIGMDKGYTQFDLKNIISLSSGYSKELYRFLMQWKTYGHSESQLKYKRKYPGLWNVHINQFRELLCIPESYRMGDIKRQILNPAKDEFIEKDENGYPMFDYFEIKEHKEGNKITYLDFIFKVNERGNSFEDNIDLDSLSIEEQLQYYKNKNKQLIEKHESEKLENKKRGLKRSEQTTKAFEEHGNNRFLQGLTYRELNEKQNSNDNYTNPTDSELFESED